MFSQALNRYITRILHNLMLTDNCNIADGHSLLAVSASVNLLARPCEHLNKISQRYVSTTEF